MPDMNISVSVYVCMHTACTVFCAAKYIIPSKGMHTHNTHNDTPTLPYARTHAPINDVILHCWQLECQEIAQRMAEYGLRARAYHAGLKPKERHDVQREWMAGTIKVRTHPRVFKLHVHLSCVLFFLGACEA